MKKVLKNIFLVFAAGAAFMACEKEDPNTILNPNANTEVTLSSSSLVLIKDQQDQQALTVAWTEPDYGYSAVAQYNVWFDAAGGDFSEGKKITAGSAFKKDLTGAELNNIALGLGLTPEVAGMLDVKVEVVLSPNKSIYSDASSLEVTAFPNKLDLSTTWGLVGSATPNGWDGPDVPFYKTSAADVFVAYATLIDGEIKIRENNDWTVNYGDDGANGTLELNGANIAVKAGTYKVEFNQTALTYKIEPYTWGLVGDATPNGWDGPDLPLTYDPGTDSWKGLVTLADGQIKIRLNNDWALNYGDTGADGTLDNGGDNIVVTAGNYLITANFNTLEYTLVETDIWGVIGDATPGGWDSDTNMVYDVVNDVWKVNIDLKDGKIKFRANDDWALNYGDDQPDGTLDNGGADIAVTAGNYDIVLDLVNLTYTLTKN